MLTPKEARIAALQKTAYSELRGLSSSCLDHTIRYSPEMQKVVEEAIRIEREINSKEPKQSP